MLKHAFPIYYFIYNNKNKNKMVVKKYSDGTYNIIYDKGDYVKIKKVSKYGGKPLDNADIWGEITNITGNPLTSKLTINTENGQIEEYSFNVVPSNEEGVELTDEEILNNEVISEKIIKNTDYKNIIKFKDF